MATRLWVPQVGCGLRQPEGHLQGSCQILNLSQILVMSDSLPLQGLQHARPPCPSPSPKVYSNSCPVSRWCHPTISSSVVPFSSHLQSFPASGPFPMSQFFPSGGQSIAASASVSVLPVTIQGWSPLGLTCLISLASLVLMIKNLPAMQRPGFDSWVRKIFWRREWLPTSIF